MTDHTPTEAAYRRLASVTRTALVIDKALPPGLAANAAAVLAVTLGRRLEHLVGPDGTDAAGGVHAGITTVNLPVLAAPADLLAALADQARRLDLFIVEFTDLAQAHRSYDDYLAQLATSMPEALRLRGIAIHGPSRPVLTVTGSLPLLK
jgi:hypothetical protein